MTRVTMLKQLPSIRVGLVEVPLDQLHAEGILSRLLLYVMKLCGCRVTYQQSEQAIETVSFDTEDVLSRVQQCSEAMELLYDKRAAYILLGRQEMQAIMHASDFYMDHPFGAYLHKDSERRFFGLRLVLVPWMEGMVVVPELGEDT